ncbi:MAG: ribonuclease P protein component [Pseudomonadota bacterium]
MSNSDFSFDKSHRLLNSADYKQVFDNVQFKSADNQFTALATVSKSCNTRVGIIVAKKHVRRATQRNQIKRVIRESFRHHKPCLTGMDIIILARSGALSKPNQALFKSLAKHWQRLIKQHEKASFS